MKKRSYLLISFLLAAGFTLWFFERDAVKEVKEEEEEHEVEHGEEGHDDHADEDHEKEKSSEEEALGGVGAGNAVRDADEDSGIRLSEKAIEVLQLTTVPYTQGNFPQEALVYYQDRVGVYRLRDGWFKLVPLQVEVFELGDHIVTKGVGLLRAAELDAFSGEVGHSH